MSLLSLLQLMNGPVASSTDFPDSQRMRPAFIGLLLIVAAYAAAFIYRTSFEVGGVRYFCLLDDAMISMRYAKNFASGMGLVWNGGGEHVEGFTNPLWVMYMSFFHLLPIPPEKVSLCIQVSGAICLLGAVIVVRKISMFLFPGSRIAEYVPAILTGTYIPLLNWTLQGMEVGPLTFLAVWVVWMALRGLRSGRFPTAMYWVLGATTLIRVDITGLAVVLLACLAIADPRNRRQHILVGGSIVLSFLVIQTAIRYAYYGELLPNTYYLKMTGVSLVQRLQRGGTVFLDFVSGMTWIVFLVPFIALVLYPTSSTVIVAILFLTQCAYSIYVGGDAWEWWGGSNRYIAVAMPMFFILFGLAFERLYAIGKPLITRSSRVFKPLVAVGLSLILLVSMSQLNEVKGMASASDWLDGGVLLVSAATGGQPDLGLSDVASVFRWLMIPDPLDWSENITMVKAALLLDSITAPGAGVAVVRAGTLPYFSQREFIDILGKNDKTIARGRSRPITGPGGRMSYVPGHSKWSYAYSIGQCKPDVIYELWVGAEEARPFLDADYEALSLRNHIWYLLRGSTKIRWDFVEMAG